jgi:GMP synthase-like glutamine amidotransferase
VSARILILQPDAVDPPGPLEAWLTDAGASTDLVHPPTDEVPEDLTGYDGLVCLGGAMGALDDIEHPWLAKVRKLLAKAVTERVPTLAICLGAQLLAAATGGQVRPVPDGPEAGTLLVAKRDAAGNDLLFGELPFTPDVLQFHTDEVHVLPPRAEHLAASPRCTNQAFRVGGSAYGLQFHIESTPEVVTEWAQGAPDIAAKVRPGQLEQAHLIQAHEDIAATWQPFVARFVQLVRGDLEVEPSLARSLPLA